ncbi:MAG: hypothetical protein WC915_04190 [archaeon]|jgi:hypothetical protein
MNAEVNLDYFLKKWYWEGIDKITNRYFLDNLEDTKFKLKSLLKKRKFIGVSKDIPKNIPKNSIVIGGPCITDSSKKITLESLTDLFNIILIAKKMNVPAIIYLSVKEEEMRSGHSWKNTYKSFSDLIKNISALLDYKSIIIIDTSNNNINSTINDFCDKIKNNINEKNLNELYYIGNNDHRKNNSQNIDKIKINIHRRFLITYFPEFIEKISGIKKPNVFVVENIQQSKVILTAKIISNYGKLYHLAYLPTPDLSGNKRMYSSQIASKIFIEDTSNNKFFNKISHESIIFYSSIIPKISNEKLKSNESIQKLSKMFEEASF